MNYLDVAKGVYVTNGGKAGRCKKFWSRQRVINNDKYGTVCVSCDWDFSAMMSKCVGGKRAEIGRTIQTRMFMLCKGLYFLCE